MVRRWRATAGVVRRYGGADGGRVRGVTTTSVRSATLRTWMDLRRGGGRRRSATRRRRRRRGNQSACMRRTRCGLQEGGLQEGSTREEVGRLRDRGGEGGACVAVRRAAAPLRDGAAGEGDEGGAGRGMSMVVPWHDAAASRRRSRSAIFWAAGIRGRPVVSARTLGMWLDPSGTGRCVPRAG